MERLEHWSLDARISRHAPLLRVLIYAAAALVWILISDQIVGRLPVSHGVEVLLNSVKGVLFVAVTSIILYALITHLMRLVRTSEDSYHSLFENATEGVTLYRVVRDARGSVADLVILDANPAQAAWTGVTREEAVGARMSAPDGLDDEMRRYFQLVREAAERGSRVDTEVCTEERDTLVSVMPFERDLWAVAAIDITEVHRAQAALREEDERIRRAYVDVLDAVTGGKLVLMTEAEMEAALGRPLTKDEPITSPSQLAGAREQVRRVAQHAFPGIDADAVLSATGEALNNVLKHAGGGSYRVFASEDGLQVAVSDHGPGIDFRTLPRATLAAGFSTTSTLGMGFTIMLQVCDRVRLSTRPGMTIVVLESEAPAPLRRPRVLVGPADRRGTRRVSSVPRTADVPRARVKR